MALRWPDRGLEVQRSIDELVAMVADEGKPVGLVVLASSDLSAALPCIRGICPTLPVLVLHSAIGETPQDRSRRIQATDITQLDKLVVSLRGLLTYS